jgi:oligopeptide transport system ATP-binding protein
MEGEGRRRRFYLEQGETLGIVGESGCGKSVTNLSVMRLISSPPGKIMGGDVFFHGKSVLSMSEDELRDLRGNKISMIFQDPMTSLNPFLRISTQLVETLCLHQGLSTSEAREKAVQMLRLVGIPTPEKRIDAYPHQFSGGMRQRAMIAMALSCNPEINADEPTTALDVTIQAQILRSLKTLQSNSIRPSSSSPMIWGRLGNVRQDLAGGRVVERAYRRHVWQS